MPGTLVIDTVVDPSWWTGATTVKITTRGGAQYTAARSSTDLLPEGVSTDTGQFLLLIPWENIDSIQKVA